MFKSKRLSWYKNRLAAMSGAEIVHRLREAGRQKHDQVGSKYLAISPRDFGALPEIPGLRLGLATWTLPDELSAQWQQDAAAARAGAHDMFGMKWPACTMHDIWHLDPVSNKTWPRDLFCFAIDYRHISATGKATDGDIKYVWELNRLQYLQPVAALAYKNNDVECAIFCANQIESWIDNNPPFLGVNWNSGIELALRVVSILTVTTLIGEHLTRSARAKIWSSLHAHGLWIARYPSRYSSGNNHRTAEALGLFMLGALCPHFAEAAAWKKTGWDILCDSAMRQILPDGTGAEQAVAYAASVLETLLTGYVVAKAYDIAVPDIYVQRLTLGGEYLRWLTDAAGNLPHIGDDDNACVFGAYHNGDRYAADVLGCIAAVTQRADLTPPNVQPHLRQAIFGFAPTPDFAPYGVRQFTHGGMTVGRTTSAQGDIILAFDHGPLGYLSIAAHGHADTLALWLHIGEQPVFVDAGTYLYHAKADERCAFRSTGAHNTLSVAGADSSTMSGNFNWSNKARAVVRDFVSRGDFWQCDAEHDGYLEEFQCLHRRCLNVSPTSGAVIEDSLIGPEPLPVEISFLLHPALTARIEGNEIAVMKGEILLLRLRHESDLRVTVGAPNTPTGGWYSPSFGVKQATTRLSFSGVLSPEQKATTTLYWAS